MKYFFNKKVMRMFPCSTFTKLAFFMLVIMPASSANAATNTNNQSKSLLQQIEGIITSLKTYINQYEQEFSEGWGEMSGEVHGAIQSSIGDLGIPDPILSGKNISTVVSNQKTDMSIIDPRLKGTNAQHEWHQDYSLGQSQSVLGKEGQREQNQETEISKNAVGTSDDLASVAQQDIVTQDILKKIAIQNVQSTLLLKSLQQNLQVQTRAGAVANMNLTDMSERIDQQSRKQEYESNANASQVIQSAASNDAFWKNATR